MRKAILMLLLAVVSSNSMAEWVVAGSNEVFIAYADTATLSKDGDNAKIWVLYNYKSAQVTAGRSWISLKTQYECACKDNLMRQLSYSFYSESMGEGNVVYSKPDFGKWMPVESGSIIGGLLKIACGRQKTNLSSSEAPKWVKVGGAETKDVVSYADPETMRRDANTVKMWSLLDFKTVQTSPTSKSFMSMKLQYEYDCKQERSRKIAHNFHLENMGGGEAAYSDSEPGKWEPINPGSIRETLWKFACGQR